MTDYYQKSGIEDVAAFYHSKFFVPQDFDYLQEGQRFKHHVDFSKFLWILANVPEGSKVLDLGCGSGTLKILKAKNCYLVGFDISQPNCQQALRNGYDEAHVGDMRTLPFEAATFDIVVSLDVLGHIAFPDKDTCIDEMARVLKPDGVMLHGIESDAVDYEGMTHEELKKFIDTDGHVGMEDQDANVRRFRRVCPHVDSQFQFNLAMSCDEVIKQHEQYPEKFQANPMLINRLKSFNDQEKEAWNLAMGFIFERVMHFRVPVPDKWGFLLLRASREPLSPDGFNTSCGDPWIRKVQLGTGDDRFFRIEGFYHPESDRHGAYRWTSATCSMQVPRAKHYRITLATSRPFEAKGAGTVISLGTSITHVPDDFELITVDLERQSTSEAPMSDGDTLELSIATQPFRPSELSGSLDERTLGVRVYEVRWAEEPFTDDIRGIPSPRQETPPHEHRFRGIAKRIIRSFPTAQ